MFNTAAIFSNNMVLQRNKNVRIFGNTDSNHEIICEINNQKQRAFIKDGKFTIILNPMKEGGPYDLKLTQGEYERIFTNVMIGEVWLAGGQSNMELELQNSLDGNDFLKDFNTDKIRFYYTNKISMLGEELYKAENNSCWNIASPENSKAWSAVGTYFAIKLQKELNVTVGIIGCNWGGTFAACWQSREKLLSHYETADIIHEYDEITKGKTNEQMIKEFDDYEKYAAEWGQRVAKVQAEFPEKTWDEVLEIAGENRYPGPMGIKNPLRPCGLYETMLKRIAPYTLGGFIYYQGEQDEVHPEKYYHLLSSLIEQWRDDFMDRSLPFINVQLPMFGYTNAPDNKKWAILRQAQMNVFKTIKNTGIAIIVDCGEIDNIHPTDKRPVGERLALQALYHVYGRNEIKAFSPILKNTYTEGNQLKLIFDYVYDGLVAKGELESFKIAGGDGIFFDAEAEICGKDIILKSEKVDNPVYAQYAFTNYMEIKLFNSEGLPVAPFNTLTD